MKKSITINLNDFVKVKLNDMGKAIYCRETEELNEIIKAHGGRPLEIHMPDVDEDGYTTFQLHSLITLFGPHITLGKSLPFEIDILYEVVENTLAVDAEPVRHGRWVAEECGLAVLYHCSVCGAEAIGYDGFDGSYYSEDSDYCPRCGAKMDGGNEE